jgi:acylphosphatase
MSVQRLAATVRGRVQFVMFRDFTQRKASTLGLKGWVWNNPDGTVSVVAEGEEETLKKLLEQIEKGPILARVDDVTHEWQPATQEFSRFDIMY